MYLPKGRMADVLPLLCEKWCSLSYLVDITGEDVAEIRAEIKAIRAFYVVDDQIICNGKAGRPSHHFRVVAVREGATPPRRWPITPPKPR